MEVITQHDRFFAKLVHLIPSDLYLHTETLTGYNNANAVVKTSKKVVIQEEEESSGSSSSDSGEEEEEEEETSDLDNDEDEENGDADMTIQVEEPTSKYYKHRKLPLTADERKVRSQENKKRKYAADDNSDVEDGQSIGSSSIHRIKVLPKQAHPEDDGAKMESLRQKLQEKILALKEQRASKKLRTNGTENKPSNQGKEGKTQGKGNLNKGKAMITTHSEDVDNDSINSLKNDLASHDDDNMSALTYDSIYRNQNQSDEGDFEFSNIAKYSKEELLKPKESKSKKDGGKVQRLKRLLQEAERKRERLKALTTSGDDILVKKAKGEQWNDALESAAGGKPLVVSTTGEVSTTELRIKKALKRREKKKEKSAEEWSKRLQKVDDDKKVKILKREENILQRKHKDDIVKEKKPLEGAGNKGPVSIRKPGSDNQKSGKSEQGNIKKNNRAGFEGKKSVGSFLNEH